MGKEMTKENAVMAESSMFIISSFFAFRASISSRVMSRDSIEEKSPPFFLLPMAKATVAVLCERARGATKALVEGTVAKAKASATIQRKQRVMISTSVLVLI